jgi:hypothetical protein
MKDWYRTQSFNKMLYSLKVRGKSWIWKPVRYQKVSVKNKLTYNLYKGKMLMKNRNLIVGLGLLALSMQAFTLICSGALKQGYIDGFNTASMITLALALILSVWSQRSQCEINRDAEERGRDIDNLYRYVDETARDVREEIRDCERSCNAAQCCKPGKR